MKITIKIIVGVLTFLSLIILIITYLEVSTPIPNYTCNFRSQKISLKKGISFKFKIHIGGQYRIDINPIDQSKFNNEKIELSLRTKGAFGSKEVIEFTKYNSFASAFFYASDNENYEAKFEKTPNKYVDKVFEIKILESTAEASKNFYFKREFRPYYLMIFRVSIYSTIILLITSFILIKKYR